jgi:hypothetical protein
MLGSRNLFFAVALLSALITFLLILFISNLVSSVFYAALAAIVSFGLVSLLYTKPSSRTLSFPSNVESIFTAPDILTVMALFISAVAIYLIPSMGDNLIWADWLAIPFLNYVRAAAAVLMTTILPGYFLLAALDHRRQFTGVEAPVLSYLLSLLVTPLLAAIAANADLTMIKFGTPLLVSLNFALLVVFLAGRLNAARNEPRKPTWPAGLKDLRRIVLEPIRSVIEADPERCYLVISAAGVLAINLAISYRLFLYPPYLIGDQWVHHAVARLYERFGNQVFVSQSLVTSFYPNWFHIYLASLFSLSGIPSTNTYFLMNFTNIFGLLAFYVLACTFFKSDSRKIAATALALTLFSGFGWAYDLWLRFAGTFSGDLLTRLYQSSISSYDILFANTYFGSANPDLTSDLQVMALPALLMLLALTNRDNLKGPTRYALISLLVALAFLAHVVEAGVFVAILLIAVVLSRKIAGAWKIASAAFLGLLIAGAAGAIISERNYFSVTAYYLVLGLAAVTVPLAFMRQKTTQLPVRIFRSNRPVLSTARRRKLAIELSLIGLTIWAALLLTWRLTGLANFNIWWTYPYQYVPVYMYPTRFGTLGLLAIPAIIFLVLVWRRDLRGFPLLFAFCAVSIALGRIWMAGPKVWLAVSYIKEFRFDKYVAIALTLPAALFICKSLSPAGRKNTTRFLFGAFFIAIILFSGYASTILYGQYTTLAFTTSPVPNSDHHTSALAFSSILTHELTPEDLAAIQYVSDNLPPCQTVAVMGSTEWTTSGFPYAKVTYMGGLFQNQTFSLTSLYPLTNKSDIYQELADARVRFVYLNQDELTFLSMHSILYQAVTELPIAFANTQVTIYSFEP